MKHARILKAVLLLLALTLAFASCAASDKNAEMENAADGGAYRPPLSGNTPMEPEADQAEKPDTDQNGDPTFVENPFVETALNNVSTFSADVDTASYSYFRKLINQNCSLPQLVQSGAVFRTEEFINYFRYEATAPTEGELFGVASEIVNCPWNEQALLMRLTLQAENAPPMSGNNLVFLIDVSGSMGSSDKLPLLKRTFSNLVGNLTALDTVSIVTYSGREAVVLEGCPGNEGERIMSAINSLTAAGSTNGEAGMEKAYQIAEAYRIEGGNNRIIMASDGDLNVGISSQSELTAYIESKRDQGVFLSVLGFGTGNYRDTNMEALADNGNGVYYYIDGESEAEKVFGTDLLSTLYTVGKDVKLQITFDPQYIAAYRLIGYENRLLDKEDFTDDTKDAGEVGAGHQVTVCYELIPTEDAMDANAAWMRLGIVYKRPNDTVSQPAKYYGIGTEAYTETPSRDMAFITALIKTAMLLHNSPYLGTISLGAILEELQSLDLSAYPDRSEFQDLLQRLL